MATEKIVWLSYRMGNQLSLTFFPTGLQNAKQNDHFISCCSSPGKKSISSENPSTVTAQKGKPAKNSKKKISCGRGWRQLRTSAFLGVLPFRPQRSASSRLPACPASSPRRPPQPAALTGHARRGRAAAREGGRDAPAVPPCSATFVAVPAKATRVRIRGEEEVGARQAGGSSGLHHHDQ